MDTSDQSRAKYSVPDDVCGIPVENWCRTSVDTVKFNYMWTITNFSHCEENIGESIRSPPFSAGKNDREKWCLRINPRGHDEESRNYISIYLLLVSCNKPEIRTHFRFSIINCNGEIVKVMESQRAYKFVYGKDWGFKKFIKREFLFEKENGILPDDSLTIFCEVSTVCDPVSVFGKKEEVKFKVPDLKLVDDFELLFLNNKCYDVTLATDSHEFRVHKAILAARSPVFSAMFEHEMTEGQSNHVNIVDVDGKVLGELLRYIYSGKVNNLDQIAFDLLAAADKYDVERLKVICEEVLYKTISVQNVVEVLILADLHSATQLKSHAIEYLCAHFSDIENTDSWKSMVKSHSHLVAEAFKFLASQDVIFSPPLRKKIKYQSVQ